MDVLIKFRHGLGDAAQFTIVLAHLRKYRPDWQIDMLSLRGKHSAFFGLCRRSYQEHEAGPDERSYGRVFQIAWHEPSSPSSDFPPTKVTRCLTEEFAVQPDLSLYRYQIRQNEAARNKAAGYLRAVCGDRPVRDGKFPAVLLHYQANTSRREKDLSHEVAWAICEAAIAGGLVPVILDWDGRSPLPDNKRIFCPTVGPGDIWGGFGSGDAEVLAGLIDQSSLMIGVDSGPLHVAGATGTPTLAVWTGHFPGQYYELADNVTHFVPENWREVGLARHPGAAEFFLRNYRSVVYRRAVNDLVAAIAPTWPGDVAGPLVRCADFWIRRDNMEQDLVIVRDVYQQDAYQTRLLDQAAGDEVVVDVGAHIGCFAKLWHNKNPRAKIICVEACPENLEALRANVGDFAEVVHAACTFEPGPMALLNAVRPDCESTGGSVVVPVCDIEHSDLRQSGYRYRHDLRELPKVTLEDLMQRFGFDRIDLLKLDCEGSEFSILKNTPSLNRIRLIIGEYHGRSRWEQFRQARLPDWQYRQLFDGGEANGLFHCVNPVWPPEDPATEAFVAELRERIMDCDQETWPAWEPRYRCLFEIARRLQAKRVVEIGVRAGYSGLTFLRAVPGVFVFGVDAAVDPDSPTYLRHAEQLLFGMGYHLIMADSHALERLPDADLVYVDGNPTYEGRLADLHLAERSTDVVLVDDDGTSYAVRRAVDDFLAQRQGVFTAERIEYRAPAYVGAMMLLRREGSRPRSRYRLMFPPRLRVAVLGGIGDSVWCLTKIPAMLREYGVGEVDVEFCGGPPYRAKEFLERFDFVHSAVHSRWSCVEANCYTAEGIYNYAATGQGWHREFDWVLVANGHLERGQRLETWLPEFEIDWAIADRFCFTDGEVDGAQQLESNLGPYCVLYLGPESGNTTAGHNRGPLWKPEDWGRLAKLCRGLNLAVVVVGAEYDRSYFERYVAGHLGECYDAIGKWHIGQTFAVIRRARFVVSYQSGIGIFAVYLGVPVAMFWRPHGDSIEPRAYVSFSEQMASAWAPHEAVDSGRYLPLVYARCSAESIAEHAAKHDWHKNRQ